ncbi:MAG: T9SS type A sorting domain-containing protein [Bacteroidota bacterium]
MNIKSIVILIFILPISIFCQIDRTRSWYFGEGLKIFFTKDNQLNVRTDLKGNTGEGTGVFNDSVGNLLYYSDWGRLYDSSNSELCKDFYLGGDGSSSQATILTSLNDSILHVFATSAEIYNPFFKNGGFNYSKYDIIKKKWVVKALNLDKYSTQTQAFVNHQNGKWQWVVRHSRLGDTLFSYLLTEKGLETCPVISHIGPFYDDWYPGQGKLKFSADGKYLVLVPAFFEKIILCEFDNQTGGIREILDVPCPGALTAEIKDNYLFVGCTFDGKIRQFSLNNLDVFQSSNKILFDTVNDYSLFDLQNAPDGSIYVAMVGSSRLGKIFKDQKGTYSFSYTSELFGNKTCRLGLPNLNASYFHAPAIDFSYTFQCNTNTINLKAKDIIDASFYEWELSKGKTRQIKYGKTLSHTFTDSGVWNIRLICFGSKRNDTLRKTITILKPLPTAYLGEDLLFSKSTTVAGTLNGPKDMHCVHWLKPGDTAETIKQDFGFKDTGLYICRALNKVMCEYQDTIRVRVCDSFAQSAIITRRNDSLVTNTYAAKYQWYRNDTALIGATGKQIRLLQNGSYKLRTWNHQGCDSFSASIQVKALAVNHLMTGEINLFPNPSHGEFLLETPSQKIRQVEIFSSDGRLVWSEKFKTKQNSQLIKFNANPGIYFIRINETVWRKIEIAD